MKHINAALELIIAECVDEEDVEILHFVRDHVIPAAFERDLMEARAAFQAQLDNLRLNLETLDGEMLLIEEKLEEGGW